MASAEFYPYAVLHGTSGIDSARLRLGIMSGMTKVWHLATSVFFQALCHGFDWGKKAQLKMYGQPVTATVCTAVVTGRPS